MINVERRNHVCADQRRHLRDVGEDDGDERPHQTRPPGHVRSPAQQRHFSSRRQLETAQNTPSAAVKDQSQFRFCSVALSYRRFA